MSADNQQERLDAVWISGFVDGEGCFHVAINRQPNMSIGWQVLPEFRVVQHQRDIAILKKFQDVFCCGNVVRNHEDRFEFRVRGLKNLQSVVQFFKKYQLRTTKRQSFERFAKIIELMSFGQHLTKEGLNKIAKLASGMNRQIKSKYLESSETICQMLHNEAKI